MLLLSMSNPAQSEDALYEALTTDRQFRKPERPRYYYKGNLWVDWWGWSRGIDDILYYKPGTEEGTRQILHRIYGPAYISKNFDIEGWYKDGELHREDGPAYRHKDSRYWLQNGKLHREDGPAVDAKGRSKEYWIGGQQWSPKEYKKEIARRKRKGLIK